MTDKTYITSDGYEAASIRTTERRERAMAKAHEDNCTYVVIMEGIGGNLYETRCETPEEAVRLEAHHRNLGWYAWIEIERA